MVDGPATALACLTDRVGAPLRVTVDGRAGAGRRTVAEAMLAAGSLVVAADQNPEVTLYVFVEVPTDEDRDALSGMVRLDRPCVAVLNKADLSGFRGVGPMATASARCRLLTRELGVPSAPLAAPIARAGCRGLDDAVLVALRILVLDPARLGTPLRRLLMAELDLYGLAHAVAAVRAGATAQDVAAALRRASGVDEVTAAVHEAGAGVRYRRVASAHAQLISRVGSQPDEAVALARATVAAEVLRSAGLRSAVAPTGLGSTGCGSDPVGKADCLHAALAWQRYAHGPVRPLHRACAGDLSRAWLRQWAAR